MKQMECQDRDRSKGQEESNKPSTGRGGGGAREKRWKETKLGSR